MKICTILTFYSLIEYFEEVAYALKTIGFSVNSFPLLQKYQEDKTTVVEELVKHFKEEKTTVVLWWADVLNYSEISSVLKSFRPKELVHICYLVDYPLNIYNKNKENKLALAHKQSLFDHVFVPARFPASQHNHNNNNSSLAALFSIECKQASSECANLYTPDKVSTLILGPILYKNAPSQTMQLSNNAIGNLKFDAIIICEDGLQKDACLKLKADLQTKYNLKAAILAEKHLVETSICSWRDAFSSQLYKCAKVIVVPRIVHETVNNVEYYRQPDITALTNGFVPVATLPSPIVSTPTSVAASLFKHESSIFYLSDDMNEWAANVANIVKYLDNVNASSSSNGSSNINTSNGKENEKKKEEKQETKRKIVAAEAKKICEQQLTATWKHFAITFEKEFIRNYMDVDFYVKCSNCCIVMDKLNNNTNNNRHDIVRISYKYFCDFLFSASSSNSHNPFNNNHYEMIYKHWDEVGRRNNFLLKTCQCPASFNAAKYLQTNDQTYANASLNLNENEKAQVYWYYRFVGVYSNYLQKNKGTNSSTNSSSSSSGNDAPHRKRKFDDMQEDNTDGLNMLPPDDWADFESSNHYKNQELQECFMKGCSVNFQETVEAVQKLEAMALEDTSINITNHLKNYMAS